MCVCARARARALAGVSRRGPRAHTHTHITPSYKQAHTRKHTCRRIHLSHTLVSAANCSRSIASTYCRLTLAVSPSNPRSSVLDSAIEAAGQLAPEPFGESISRQSKRFGAKWLGAMMLQEQSPPWVQTLHKECDSDKTWHMGRHTAACVGNPRGSRASVRDRASVYPGVATPTH